MSIIKALLYMEIGGMLSMSLTIISLKLHAWNPNNADIGTALMLAILSFILVVSI